jgi:hypothetical protein
MSWGSGKGNSGPRRGQFKVSRKLKLLFALGAFGAAIFFFWLAFNVWTNAHNYVPP